MTDLRDARAAAVTRRHRDLTDDFARALPLLLDDLDAIDRAHVPDGVISFGGEMTDEQVAEFRERWENRKSGQPTDEQIAAWIEANPKAFEIWYRKMVRVRGDDHWPLPAPPVALPDVTSVPESAPERIARTTPAKPARAARRPRGGAPT